MAELDPSLGSHCLGIGSSGNSFVGFSLDQSIVDQGVSMKVMKHVGHIYIESDKLKLKDTLKFEKIKHKTSIACLH